MLPEFPKFKLLELRDKEDIEQISLKYQPYSDFNFSSLWSWNIKEQTSISQLNGNLVVKMLDYITGSDPFISFLGNNNVNETIKKLLDFSISEGLNPELKIIPQDSIKNIDLFTFFVEEDIKHFDYIYSNEDLKNYHGHKYEPKRNFVKRFFKACPDVTVKIFDLSEQTMKEKVLGLYKIWESNKIEEGKNVDALHETLALNRFFKVYNPNHFIALGVFNREELISCSIIEVLNNDYTLSHFFKANAKYIGAYPHLMQEGAKAGLDLKQKHFFNFEQDLGIQGLRKSKTLFRPRYFLKKFSIRYKSLKT